MIGVAHMLSIIILPCAVWARMQVANPSVLEGLLDSDVGYRDFKNLRGSPDYWDQAKKDMFAMLRQLGQPTFFLTLSSADTKWPELLGCLYKLRHGRDATEEELASLTSAERMALVRNDPITTARYFKARADALRTHMLKRCPDALGGMGDYFFRVEFQQRGETCTWHQGRRVLRIR